MNEKFDVFNDWFIGIAGKNPSYYKLFKKFYEIKSVEFKRIDSPNAYARKLHIAYDFLIRNKQYLYVLPKLPVQYKKFDELYNDISRIKHMKLMLKSINSERHNSFFPKSLFKDFDIKTKICLLDVYIERKNRMKRNFNIKRISHIKDFFKQLNIKYTDNSSKDYKLFKKKIKTFVDCKIVYKKNKLIIIKIHDYHFFKQLPKIRWCLKNERYWEDYVGHNKNSQYIVFNFDIIQNHAEHRISFTTWNNDVTYCFNNNNIPLSDTIGQKYYDKI